ncbi:hypothetical protein GQ43DRAFT_454499 [Delitschia confertaspora ATCC 74209]|uniref:GID complex catalytic subunit 2 n=1 Tax=Delitschia confertaspora ATCC 74209 TaxID=1513339 RepID=A0A9P4MXK8_9PLEO|nr:hypothetical protein GQ43DRAFT_454499 [Delitschia confertaspora ATCC 74209]
MDALKDEVELLLKNDNLGRTIKDVRNTLDLLINARNKVAADPQAAPMGLAKLQTPAKQTLDSVHESLKKINGRANKYSKALDKKFKDKPLPGTENDALSSHPSLINRAIAMHLLREGQFSVASTFIEEAKAHPPHPEPTAGTPNPYLQEAHDNEVANGAFDSKKLQEDFAEMYHILHELRENRNLEPAIIWARDRSDLLESRGSNLEFELCRLHFVCLFVGQDEYGYPTDSTEGPMRAWEYARREFVPFSRRYAREVQQLMGALAYYENVADSPYRMYFFNDSAWEEVATSFTREFCSLLGLSADSPLYIAVTAGAIALPALLKMQNLMSLTRAEWTTQHELAVEIPLPPSFHFHSIFVCPVAKEQCTDQNPPMMMPCGHVVCKETLDKLSKGSKFKCPYCPGESLPKEAKKVFL